METATSYQYMPAHAPKSVFGMPFPSWSESAFTVLVVVFGILLIAAAVAVILAAR
jgi:hypothetical protein